MLSLQSDVQSKAEKKEYNNNLFDKKQHPYKNFDSIFFQIQIMLIPIMTTIIWIFLPFNLSNNKSTNFLLFYYVFGQFYTIWFIFMTSYLFDKFVLPVRSKKHRWILLVLYLIGLSLGLPLKGIREKEWYIFPGLYTVVTLLAVYVGLGVYVRWKIHRRDIMKDILRVEDPNLYTNLLERTNGEIEEENIVLEDDFELDLGSDYYNVRKLLRAETMNPMKVILVASLFHIFLAGLWVMNSFLSLYFIKISSALGQTFFGILYKILAIGLTEAASALIGQLPRKYELSMIAELAVDSLFQIYWKTLIISTDDIYVFFATILAVVLIDLFLYPGRMTKKFFSFQVKILKVLGTTPNENYDEHKRDLALAYYTHMSANAFSILAIVFCVTALRYSPNAPYWPFSISQIPRGPYLQEMTFFAVLFIIEFILGCFINFILCRKYLQIDPFQIGTTIMTNKKVRYLLIAMLGHFLHDFVFFQLQLHRLKI